MRDTYSSYHKVFLFKFKYQMKFIYIHFSQLPIKVFQSFKHYKKKTIDEHKCALQTLIH